jgi:hypothetical protein
VREAVLHQRPIVEHRPEAPASRCFRVLAARVAGLDPQRGGRHLRLAAAAAAVPEVSRCA